MGTTTFCAVAVPCLSLQCKDDFGSRVISYNLRYWQQQEEAKQCKEVQPGEAPSCHMMSYSHCLSLQVASVGDTLSITGLLPAHEYHYCLQAVNAVGVGRWGVSASFSTPPSSPSQVGGIKVVKRTTYGITVTWAIPLDNGDPISNYYIECGNRTIPVQGTQTEVTVTDLTPDTTYRSACSRQWVPCCVHCLCHLVTGSGARGRMEWAGVH